MTGRRAAARAATQAKVLAAAQALFESQGYEAVTIRGIAAAAGMSTGAIFANWAGKAEVYRDVFGHEPISPEIGRQLLAALEAAPLPSSMGTAREHYELFYAWFQTSAAPLIDAAKVQPDLAEAA